ncbi:MAG: efflux RND transporter periplasmic adaptor subunit [Deltaproteobacteria bacterium]|nr:efflux RND transporter periplasmic adaptor subunit [Deltaproteobacteria bacterium]
MKKIWRAGLVCLLAGSLLGCSASKSEKDPQVKAAGKPPVAVEAVRVQARDLIEGIDVVGSLAPRLESRVKSEYAGIVTEVYVTEWVHVKKGQPLAKLDTREADAVLQKAQAAVEAARANVLQAEVGGNRADREAERAKNLKESGLITQQNFDDAQTEKAAAQARISAAKAQLLAAEKELNQIRTRLAKAVIRAPLDGVVAQRDANVGDLVGEAGSTRIMFRIVDNRLLDLTFTVPSTEMAKIRIGQPLDFTTDALPGRTFTGQIKFINPAVNETDRSMKVIAEIRNDPEVLKSGLFVKGRIVTGLRAQVLVIPRTALVDWDVKARQGDVWLILQGQAKRRKVQTGSLERDWVEVASGLTAGDPIIIRGGFNVQEGDRVQASESAAGK